jgi:hypothetical protein
MDVAVWLRSLGLDKYEAAFRENEINEKVLPNLTAEDLKDMGVALATAACCSTPSLPCASWERKSAARRSPLNNS